MRFSFPRRGKVHQVFISGRNSILRVTFYLTGARKREKKCREKKKKRKIERMKEREQIQKIIIYFFITRNILVPLKYRESLTSTKQLHYQRSRPDKELFLVFSVKVSSFLRLFSLTPSLLSFFYSLSLSLCFSISFSPFPYQKSDLHNNEITRSANGSFFDRRTSFTSHTDADVRGRRFFLHSFSTPTQCNSSATL